VTTANISDKAGAMKMLREGKDRLGKVEKLLVDGGYNGNPSPISPASVSRRKWKWPKEASCTPSPSSRRGGGGAHHLLVGEVPSALEEL
jgi:hypothetical protein